MINTYDRTKVITKKEGKPRMVSSLGVAYDNVDMSLIDRGCRLMVCSSFQWMGYLIKHENG